MKRFAFVQISDHHLGASETALLRGLAPAHTFRAVLRHIAQNVAGQADFIVSTGDLIEPSSDAAYKAALAILNVNSHPQQTPGPLFVSVEGLINYPMYFLPGNHDDRLKFCAHLFPQVRPIALFNTTFVHQGIQFVCVDWGSQVKAVANPATLDFVAHALKSERPSILMMHHYPAPIGSAWLDSFIADEVDRFWNRVRGQNVLGIFCGHAHITYETIVDGIPVYGLRSTIFQFARTDEPVLCLEPPHYRLVTIENDQISTQVFEVPL
jgi:Icc protein